MILNISHTPHLQSIHVMKKQHLPEKICIFCDRPFSWRKKWARCWDEIKYCSERCKREGKKHQSLDDEQ
ncbi:DUF2256 domain-containing protein [Acinetobacter baretiae]|uniref:DUF2256 domain-containing protein n=1 Tax=Acinetobacter baretiae TaxID=2605383 RepID=UPI001F3BD0C5|nr:DUF2256 domain-containing protein [Acinetobacter baretiae]